jgi:hypothetical protein
MMTKGLIDMPIARATNAIGTGAFVSVPGTAGQATENLVPGLAVAITPAGIIMCSSTVTPEAFTGFALNSVVTGKPVAIVSMRGSVVTPITEDGNPMTPGLRLFLSDTPGKVTHIAPTGPGKTVMWVGTAVSPTDMVLLTDFRSVR